MFLPTLEFRLVSPGRRNRFAMRWIKGELSVSATIFARRKSAGGNMIGLNQQRKSHASSRSFGGWVRAHFSERQLVIEPSIMVLFNKSSFWILPVNQILENPLNGFFWQLLSTVYYLMAMRSDSDEIISWKAYFQKLLLPLSWPLCGLKCPLGTLIQLFILGNKNYCKFYNKQYPLSVVSPHA